MYHAGRTLLQAAQRRLIFVRGMRSGGSPVVYLDHDVMSTLLPRVRGSVCEVSTPPHTRHSTLELALSRYVTLSIVA